MPEHCPVFAMHQSAERGDAFLLNEFGQHADNEVSDPLALVAIYNRDRDFGNLATSDV